jgi:hypothetical protein
VVGTSTSASTAAVAGFLNPVTWTFAGGLAITDTSTYTAVLAPNLTFLFNNFDPYTNGRGTFGTGDLFISATDTVFQATFSAATPVPFEFSPALGLVGLGALWVAKKKFAKKTK